MTNTPFHPTGKLEVRVSVCQSIGQNRAEKVSNGDLGCRSQQPQHLFVARPGNQREISGDGFNIVLRNYKKKPVLEISSFMSQSVVLI
jgi:hypothetical protein